MRLHTSADHDPELAKLIGRFSQVCNYLERQIEFVLTRLLPLTTDMGNALFCGNPMSRNIEILNIVTALPEVPISEAERSRLRDLVPRLRQLNEDRNRFMHNQIMGGMHGEPLLLITHKQDVAKTAAFPISKELLVDRIEEGRRLWTELYTNPITYDLSQWTQGWPQFLVKEYPGRAKKNKRRRRNSSGAP